MDFNFYVLRDNVGAYLSGLLTTIEYSLVAILLSLLWGAAVGVVIYSAFPLVSRISRAYVMLFRETPLLVQLFLLYYGLPNLGIALPASVCAAIALMLNEGAYIAEIVRGGLDGIERGQVEAAASVGFSRTQTLRLVLFPQAWHSVVDSILGMVSIIIKDTSLLTVITIMEITGVAQEINARLFEPTTSYVVAAVLYLLLFGISQGVVALHQRRRSHDTAR